MKEKYHDSGAPPRAENLLLSGRAKAQWSGVGYGFGQRHVQMDLATNDKE